MFQDEELMSKKGPIASIDNVTQGLPKSSSFTSHPHMVEPHKTTHVMSNVMMQEDAYNEVSHNLLVHMDKRNIFPMPCEEEGDIIFG